MAKKTLGKRAAKTPVRATRRTRVELNDDHRSLIARLSERTGLLPQDIVERALAGYAASVAPGMPLEPPAKPKQKTKLPSQRLFLSIDGKPEVEVAQSEFVLGSGADGVDLRLDLPLISPRHARILWRGNSFVFEDMKSAHKSYRNGQPVDVHPIESGDEIDLGGFLPVRFRIG